MRGEWRFRIDREMNVNAEIDQRATVRYRGHAIEPHVRQHRDGSKSDIWRFRATNPVNGKAILRYVDTLPDAKREVDYFADPDGYVAERGAKRAERRKRNDRAIQELTEEFRGGIRKRGFLSRLLRR